MNNETEDGAGANSGPPFDDAAFSAVTNTGDLDELRRLLLGREQLELADLKARLDAMQLTAEELASVLPEAIVARSQQDRALADALAPTIEEAVKTSVERNPRTLAQAIFPIIGPAIRKSIAEALSGLVQTINQTLEHSFSVNGLRWRMEAIRTGVPFPEIVLRHSLLYRVEQVFLIHRETGLLIQQAAADQKGLKDADLVSSMLKAISDFAEDSFEDGDGALRTFTVGELTILVEDGPNALLAAAVRGHAPSSFRSIMVDALATVHLQQGRALREYTGDSAPFEAARPTLESCLRMEKSKTGRGRFVSPALIGTAALLAVAAGFFVIRGVRAERRWNRAVAAVHAVPGLVVLESDRSGRNTRIAGLRDPAAERPDAILAGHGIDTTRLTQEWEDYLSFRTELVAPRARAWLATPDSVRTSFSNGTLLVAGQATDAWLEAARGRAGRIPGVVTAEFRVRSVEAMARLEEARIRLNQAFFSFAPGSSVPTWVPVDAPDSLVTAIRALQAAAPAALAEVTIDLVGLADSTGSDAANQDIRRRRALAVRDLLVARGITSGLFNIVDDETLQSMRAVQLVVNTVRSER